jgi:hypothetical protein
MKATPLLLTQDEVDAMAAGGKAASAVRRRMAAQKVGKTARQARKAEKASPPPLSKKEMAAIQAGRIGADLRKRIFVSSPQVAEAVKESLGPKQSPSEAPPKKK